MQRHPRFFSLMIVSEPEFIALNNSEFLLLHFRIAYPPYKSDKANVREMLSSRGALPPLLPDSPCALGGGGGAGCACRELRETVLIMIRPVNSKPARILFIVIGIDFNLGWPENRTA